MEIKVTYKRVRGLRMRVVSNGDLHISAPILTPKSEINRFIRENEEWIRKAQQRQLAANRKRSDFYGQLDLSTREKKHAAAQQLDTIIHPMLEKYTRQMGVQPTLITYQPTISRWGSCNKKTREIRFSLYLLLLPEWCVEHTVVHELAHLIEANHGPKFYAVMDRHFPRWKEARKITRELVRRGAPTVEGSSR